MPRCRSTLPLLAGALILTLLAPSASLYAARRGGGTGAGRGTTTPTTPPASISQTQTDQQAASDARDAFNKATKAFDDLITKLMAGFESAPDTLAAKQAITDARTALEAAKTPVLAQLQTQPDYLKAAADEAAAQKKSKALRDAGAPQDQISAQSTEVFRLGGLTSALERTALDDSTDVRAAQKALTNATTRLADLRETFRVSLKDNPDYQTAKQAKDDAQKKLADANTKVNTDLGKPSANSGL